MKDEKEQLDDFIETFNIFEEPTQPGTAVILRARVETKRFNNFLTILKNERVFGLEPAKR